MLEPLAIVIQIPAFDRCRCPTCLRLDIEFPNEGYQLALFRYEIGLRRAEVFPPRPKNP